MAVGAWIENLSWPEVAQRIQSGTPILIPVGAAAKEHGYHLPMNTDYLLARGLADVLARRLPILVAPVVSLGYYPAFAEFAGSQSIEAATFQASIEQILDRLIDQGAARLAIFNTGVSTEAPLTLAAASVYRRRQLRVGVAHLRLLGAKVDSLWQKRGGHADERETSLMLALAPDAVHLERVPSHSRPAPPAPVFARPSILSTDPTRGDEYTQDGATGDPAAASAEKGHQAVAAIAAELEAGLRALFGAALG